MSTGSQKATGEAYPHALFFVINPLSLVRMTNN